VLQAERRNIAQGGFGALKLNQGWDASPATTTTAGSVGLGNAPCYLATARGRVGCESSLVLQGLLWE